MSGQRKTLSQLWQEFLLLTREMAKFLTMQDFEMFQELLNQREKLQNSIDEFEDKEYRLSAEGQKLIQIIMEENQGVMRRLEFMRNTSQRQQTVSNAYEGYSRTVGGWMDRKS